jgi:sugar O-acyltransferase (sialic acid O-acetyltransferase NeuD family)
MKTLPIPVLIPLLNPNEPEARLVSINVSEGQRVLKNDILCTLETTKSTSELVAEVDGFIIGLIYSSGDSVMAGDVFCHLADSPETPSQKSGSLSKPSLGNKKSDDIHPGDLPPGLRITQPALSLARQHHLNLEQLPTDSLITERYVQMLVENHFPPAVSAELFDPTRVIVYGGGGHGKSLIELIRSLGNLRIQGIVDDGLVMGESVLDCSILGGEDILSKIYGQGIRLAVNAVGGIGNIHSRINVFHRLTHAGFQFPILIHPSAVVEPSASLSPGVQVFPHAYIGSETHIGFGVIINTGAVISHDCIIEDYANISPGALLAGGVTIGTRTLIGMGVTINLGVIIGPDVRIGNSTTVKGDVPAGYILRAGSIWPE